jgi:hypothetical protein
VLIGSMAGRHAESDREQYWQMIDTVREMGEVPEQMTETTKHLLFSRTTVEENPDLSERRVDRWRTYPAEAIDSEPRRGSTGRTSPGRRASSTCRR